MKQAKVAAALSAKQVKNFGKFILGKPLSFPSLSSTTLDKDDLDLARQWLVSRSRWQEKETVARYEAEFASWNGSKYAFAFMSGRVALSACIYALGLQPGDEVILPGYTCVAVPNAFHFAGIKTVYCDIELDTYGLEANLIESKITSKTRAILLHHLFGLVCRDYELILDVANRYNLKVIEDCAHSTGAKYKDRKIGNFGHVAFYSSEQSKIFNTIQGGIAITNDQKLGLKLEEYYNQAPCPDENWIGKQLHNIIMNFYQFKHPQRWLLGDVLNLYHQDKRLISTTYEEEQGIRPNYYGRKMPAPIAALGINQLQKIDYYNECRRQTAKIWNHWCDVNSYKKPLIIDDSIPVYLRYPVMVEPEKKRNISWAIQDLNIVIGVWFVSNVHPSSQEIQGCPNANKAVAQCINFPSLLFEHKESIRRKIKKHL